MAVDKLVDSTQLDADLTSVANAIRTKGGTAAPLAFPQGFVSAVQAIPSGETDYAKMIAVGQSYTGDVISTYSFTAVANQFRGVKWSKALLYEMRTRTSTNANTTGSIFFGANNLKYAILPNVQALSQECFRGCTELLGCDFGTTAVNLAGANLFYGCTKLATLVIRRATIAPLGATGNFTNTPFASGKAGGTIYIPKALYDHLGDGTSLDYKAATNWSTVNGYGTITWAQIEGSIYETQYADGTPIT